MPIIPKKLMEEPFTVPLFAQEKFKTLINFSIDFSLKNNIGVKFLSGLQPKCHFPSTGPLEEELRILGIVFYNNDLSETACFSWKVYNECDQFKEINKIKEEIEKKINIKEPHGQPN
jgi:hypothetical protein